MQVGPSIFRPGRLWLLYGFAICLILSTVLYVRDGVQTAEDLLAPVQNNAQRDFTESIRQLRSVISTNPDEIPRLPGLGNKVPYEVIVLKVGQDGELLEWSSNQYIPSRALLAEQTKNLEDGLLSEQGYVYYNVKTFVDSAAYFKLLPLHITYPIDNAYLQDFFYLGRHSNDAPFAEMLSSRQFSLLPVAEGVTIRLDDEVVYAVRMRDVKPLRARNRRSAVLISFVGLVLGLSWLYYAMLAKWPDRRLQRDGIFLSLVMLIRVLLLAYGFPRSYVDIELFSPSVLAINGWNPSLGDLSLNVLVILLASFRLYHWVRQDVVARFLARRGGMAAWWVVAGGGVVITAFLYTLFFWLFDLLVVNSQTEFEFDDLFKLDVYAGLLFLNVACLLICIFLALYGLAGILHLMGQQLFVRGRLYFIWLVVGIGLAFAMHQTWQDGLAFGVLLLLVYSLRATSDESLRFKLIQSMVLIAGFAALTNIAISKTLQHVREDRLRHYAQKFFSAQDWVTEYIFDEVAQNMTNSTQLWSQLPAQDAQAYEEILDRVVNRHLINNFKGYDFRLFVYDGAGRLRGSNSRVEALPFSTEGPQAMSTLSEQLYRLPARTTREGYAYVGNLPLETPGGWRLQVELYPKLTPVGKLYPQLLVDRGIRRRLSLPKDYELAIYREGQLIRKEGDYAFPAQIAAAPLPPDGAFSESEEFVEFRQQASDGRLILVRTAKRDFFDRLTAFSFLYYFYVLVYGLYRLPSFMRAVNMEGSQVFVTSFSYRLQFFMAVVSFLPLLTLWLLTSYLFDITYREDAEAGLARNLKQVSAIMESEDAYLRSIPQGSDIQPDESELINTISNLLSADMNVYNTQGRLVHTTRPKLYSKLLSSSYMAPMGYQALNDRYLSEYIAQEHIGKLNYQSGYIPLYSRSAELKGFLNIPYYVQQGVLEGQVKNFAAYLINIYVVIMLGIIIGGLSISRSLTHPLTMLKQKLDITNLGATNEKLNWRSRDEIGAIISSYNQMLTKLEQSEKKLAKNATEMAWREMARQVAHEIKNPLTPMKLSIQHLQRALQKPEKMSKEVVDKVTSTLLSQIDSLSKIASSFSQFATMPTDSFERVSLNRLIEEAYELYAESQEATLSTDLPKREIFVWGDRGQLSRVIINLVRNALQAMDKTKGRIALRLSRDFDQAVVSVEDNGKGIPHDLQDRIFEPNFSTKNSGMGLGLAITQRLVQNMDGNIHFVSKEGLGTTFYVSFPIYEERALAPASPENGSPNGAPPLGKEVLDSVDKPTVD